jgi:transposase
LLETIASMTESIQGYDRQLELLAEEYYPETKLLRRVHGIGRLTALAFVLTLEDPSRFQTSRAVGAYLGLVPSRDQSGERDPQKRISKQGNALLRRLLVGSAQRILGPFGEDCDLRRHGLKIFRARWQGRQEAGRGGRRPQTLRVTAPFVGQRGSI